RMSSKEAGVLRPAGDSSSGIRIAGTRCAGDYERTTEERSERHLTGESAKLGELANAQSLAARRDVSRFLPGGEYTADCVESRTAHLREILAGERKLDDGILFARYDVALGQAQQRVRNALIDPLRRELSQTLLSFAQPAAHDFHQVQGDLRIPVDQIVKRRLGPADLDRIDHGRGLGRIAPVGKRGDRAKCLPRTDETDDDLIALGTRLRDSNASVDERVTAVSRHPLLKEPRTPRQRLHAAEPGNLVERPELQTA